MRDAGPEFLQEEARLRGGRPRLKAVLYPFDLDYGLTPDGGFYDNTVFGGEPGKLMLAPGYITAGSWTSPVMQAFCPHLDTVIPSWQDQAGYMETSLSLRSATSPADLEQQDFVVVAAGEEINCATYFQIKVAFQEKIRAWAVDDPAEADDFTASAAETSSEPDYLSYAVDGVFPGMVTRLRLEGRLAIPESDILDPGIIQVNLARDFRELRSGDHVLVVDNRRRQWLPHAPAFRLLGWPWEEKRLALYHGWELPNGRVEWLLVYQGVLERLADAADGWGERHQVKLISQDWIVARLQHVVGAPDPDGRRRPFLRGATRCQATLTGTIPAHVSDPVKSGNGSAILKILGHYRGDTPKNYLLEAETTGDVGIATFRWSINHGQSWLGREITTVGAEDPVELEEGLAVYWESGAGPDLVAGDRWTFAAQPTLYQYMIFGAPFESITTVYLNGEETWDGITADPRSGLIQIAGRNAHVEARVVKDDITHPVDIIREILDEVGLTPIVHMESFASAKSLTPEYAIGVCLENYTAAQAIREIVKRCLYDLWVDCGEIKIKAHV